MDKFRAITLFIATAKTESFTATAKLHATDPSTVSKAIKRLEDRLGVKLFHRSTRQLKLTNAGLKYADTVESLLSKLSLEEEVLKNDTRVIGGALKVNLPVSYGRQYLLPMLCQFREMYPQIQLNLSFCDEYVDMIGESVDVSIRSGTVSDSRLIAQKLTPIKFVLCAANDKASEIKITTKSLSSYPWILFRFKQTGRTLPIDFGYKGKRLAIEPKSTVIVDDGEAMAEFCAAGAGITIMPHFIAKEAVLAKRIKVVATLDDVNVAGVYIIYAKRDHLPKRCRVFIDFVKTYIEKLGESPTKTWLDEYNFEEDNLEKNK